MYIVYIHLAQGMMRMSIPSCILIEQITGTLSALYIHYIYSILDDCTVLHYATNSMEAAWGRLIYIRALGYSLCCIAMPTPPLIPLLNLHHCHNYSLFIIIDNNVRPKCTKLRHSQIQIHI